MKNVSTLITKTTIPTEAQKGLLPWAAVPPRLYGLPKIHKPGVLLRPIISAIDTPTYHLYKFLSKILTPHVGKCLRNMKNSKEFVQMLQQFHLLPGELLALMSDDTGPENWSTSDQKKNGCRCSLSEDKVDDEDGDKSDEETTEVGANSVMCCDTNLTAYDADKKEVKVGRGSKHDVNKEKDKTVSHKKRTQSETSGGHKEGETALTICASTNLSSHRISSNAQYGIPWYCREAWRDKEWPFYRVNGNVDIDPTMMEHICQIKTSEILEHHLDHQIQDVLC
ncbi:hypothetical protein J437_LFUL002538 [Ladona fulva]|uniref:Uncharacterized protein n=1 Tax=Ladona fulva TaxID=123851 RepID=A0A8K0P8V0_LADFU|nr:hypothetical protein J437_LFUL002538 [Ladona fulva]